MKTFTLTSLAAATLLLVGCGGGASSTTGTTTTATTGTTIQVVRGPILGAIVRDNNGTGVVAKSDGNGNYTFAKPITYPIVVTGGVIDMDRDGKISVGDVKNDMNLTATSGKVVTIATTYASKPETKDLLDKIATTLGITTIDLETKTPLDSREIEAISNVLYKYAQDDNISANTLTDIENDIQLENDKYTQEDASHDSEKTEQKLIKKLSDDGKVTELSSVKEIEDEAKNLNDEYSKLYVESKAEYERENGDSEYGETEGSSSHYQGVNCASCHTFVNGTGISPRESEENEGSEGNEANENQFTSGATIFRKLTSANNNGVDGVANYTLRLRFDDNRTIQYRQGRGTGNVNVTFDTTALNKYTAEVLNANGAVTNKSATNSHDMNRLDCNSCHSATGTNNAPGRIVSFDYSGSITTVANIVDINTTITTSTTVVDTNTTTAPTTTVIAKSFQNDVLPILNDSCKNCHGSSGNFSITNSATPYAGVTPFVSISDAVNSSLLLKGSNQVGHGGGIAINAQSVQYATVQTWIIEGAKNN